MNVDFCSGVVHHPNAVRPGLFVPVFAAGRAPSWTVQCPGRLRNNLLIRLLTPCNGPEARAYLPISQR
ncbi:MAG: hypothetical protein IOC82_01740 [Aestuariivirga sp.]|uniref:citrate/2-methylcitrate synthase n=1 Tax=Aestuariivirga sp. TaxID=2650926 RepID=UPI0025BD37D1|nr:citrate/2-methylcitrate synthase [Aestuariivirga sp.]MCA3559736.1 hypothetical protein [Aestuariivirga sp.]